MTCEKYDCCSRVGRLLATKICGIEVSDYSVISLRLSILQILSVKTVGVLIVRGRFSSLWISFFGFLSVREESCNAWGGAVLFGPFRG